jgi:hypothetical protein
MEVLSRLWASQDALEDALRLESTPEEVNDTKEGKKLIRWLRWRRRVTNRLAKILKKI